MLVCFGHSFLFFMATTLITVGFSAMGWLFGFHANASGLEDLIYMNLTIGSIGAGIYLTWLETRVALAIMRHNAFRPGLAFYLGVIFAVVFNVLAFATDTSVGSVTYYMTVLISPIFAEITYQRSSSDITEFLARGQTKSFDMSSYVEGPDTAMYSQSAFIALSKGGWTPNRKIDIFKQTETLRTLGHTIFPSAKTFLAEFHGVTISFTSNDNSEHMERCRIIVSEGTCSTHLTSKYERALDVRLIPVGEVFDPQMYIMIAESGAVICVREEQVFLLGANSTQAFNTLCEGYRPKPLTVRPSDGHTGTTPSAVDTT
ncbi:SUKH-3 domain-containing protein [bacterium AH-315-F18]|nr:SUKH-3 domain-containing protein [bacterium AH-315-F18]